MSATVAFIVGWAIGFFAGVGIMCIMAVGKDADRRWKAQSKGWPADGSEDE